jgi:hypothetical protein
MKAILLLLSLQLVPEKARACTPGVDCPPPPPTSTDTSRATGYVATHINDDLYRLEAITPQQTDQIIPGDHKFIGQGESFGAQSSVLYSCTVTNISGRADGTCSSTPDDPECAGMSRSLANATTCSTPPAVPGDPCPQYGSAGFTMDEWLVFGQQYYNGMGGCFSAKLGPDKSDARQQNMRNLADFASLSAASKGTGSDISGRSGMDLPPFDWQTLAAKVNDGSTYLGLESGELIHGASVGRSFLSIFTESPFAEKLAKDTKTLMKSALDNPSDVMDRVKERKLAASPKDGDEPDPVAQLEGAAGRAPASDAIPAPAAPAGTSALTGTPGGAPKDNDSPTPPENANAALAVPAPPQELGNSEISLFQRVSLAYRHHAPKLKSYDDSKTARDLREMDTPTFFKEL